MDRRRFSFTALAGAVAVMVGAPMVVSALARRSPALANLRPQLPLSMVRPASVPAPGAAGSLDALGQGTGTATAAASTARNRRLVVIEPLPVPYASLKLENVNTDETATFELTSDGQPRPEQAALLRSFFRCKRTGRKKAMAPAVLAILLHVQKRWPDRVIEIVSGFRAPPYGAPHSKHFRGQAVDLRVRGVRTAQVRDFLWREHRGVGVGHYHGEDFVHVDWRPREPDMAWSARGEDSPLDYHPRWARKLRHTRQGDHGSVAGALTVAAATVQSL